MRIRSWTQVSRPAPGSFSHFGGLWEFQLKSGVQTPRHSQGSEEIIVALEGEGVVTLAGQPIPLQPGEVVWVPARTDHSIGNANGATLRGLSMEISLTGAEEETSGDEKVSESDLESIIDSIPDQVDEATSLQLIIQLFDTAGILSEQIDDAIGLESETGLAALQNIERRVMDAVVRISRSYTSEDGLFPRRF